MKPESRKKAQENRALAKGEREAQVIVVNSKWKITRFDAYNWAVIRKGYEKEPWYYARLIDALQALPHKILDEAQIKTLADISREIESIKKDLDALRFYRFEILKDNLKGQTDD